MRSSTSQEETAWRFTVTSGPLAQRLPTLLFPGLSCSSQPGAGLGGHTPKASKASGCGYDRMVIMGMKLIVFLEAI